MVVLMLCLLIVIVLAIAVMAIAWWGTNAAGPAATGSLAERGRRLGDYMNGDKTIHISDSQ